MKPTETSKPHFQTKDFDFYGGRIPTAGGYQYVSIFGLLKDDPDEAPAFVVVGRFSPQGRFLPGGIELTEHPDALKQFAEALKRLLGREGEKFARALLKRLRNKKRAI